MSRYHKYRKSPERREKVQNNNSGPLYEKKKGRKEQLFHFYLFSGHLWLFIGHMASTGGHACAVCAPILLHAIPLIAGAMALSTLLICLWMYLRL